MLSIYRWKFCDSNSAMNIMTLDINDMLVTHLALTDIENIFLRLW